jgi:lycopene cyclase-like protein
MVKKSEMVVGGAGPAGLALATELAGRGFSVTVVAPSPRRAWDRSYGSFERDLAGLGLESAVSHRFGTPRVELDGASQALEAPYLRLDTSRLQALLLERAERAGVSLQSAAVDEVSARGAGTEVLVSAEGRQSRLATRLFVDARGRDAEVRRGSASTPRGLQLAYGEWLEVESHGFGPGEMSLMDYRSVTQDQGGPATFLYALPEGPTRLFAQETVLATAAPLPLERLRRRLYSRLALLGVRVRAVLGVERCVIPMGGGLPERRSATLPFGAAAGMVHPATGYQLARALRRAPLVAEAVASAARDASATASELAEAGLDALWPEAERRAFSLYHLGLRALLRFDAARTRDFVREFFRLPTPSWVGFMEGALSPTEVAGAMWRLFLRAPLPLRLELVQSSFSFPRLADRPSP